MVFQIVKNQVTETKQFCYLIPKLHIGCRCAIKIEYSTNRGSHDALAGRDNPARAGFGRLSGKLRRMIDGRTDVAPPITCPWARRTLRVKVCVRKWCLNHCYVFGFHRVISSYKKDEFFAYTGFSCGSPKQILGNKKRDGGSLSLCIRLQLYSDNESAKLGHDKKRDCFFFSLPKHFLLLFCDSENSFTFIITTTVAW